MQKLFFFLKRCGVESSLWEISRKKNVKYISFYFSEDVIPFMFGKKLVCPNVFAAFNEFPFIVTSISLKTDFWQNFAKTASAIKLDVKLQKHPATMKATEKKHKHAFL